MMEVYVLVPVKRSVLVVAVGILGFVLALISLMASCVIAPVMLLAFIFAGVGFWFTFQTNIEFEYSYFDGDVRFAKVVNKSRRRKLAAYTMEEVVQIAPQEDRSVYKYVNDKTLKMKDYSSRRKDAPCYVMVVNQGGQLTVIRFEPDEKYLSEVRKKYAQKVICRKES